MTVQILYKDKDLLVCVKPAGIATQTAQLTRPDMVSLLRNQLAEEGEASELHVVHRLDQPVEGLLVFARNSKTAAYLDRQVSDASGHAMTKEYLTMVRGSLDPLEGRLENLLIKEVKTNLSRIAGEKEKGAKRASLSYKTEWCSEDGSESLIRVRLETGRHHQIRVQMAHAGHPIIGDTKYGSSDAGREDNKQTDNRRGGRVRSERVPLKLCAVNLAFTAPDGTEKTFSVTPTWLSM